MSDKVRTGLVILFLALLLLFNQPFLGIFSGELWGLPGAFLYFGLVWVLLIGILFWASSKIKDEKEP